MKKDLRIVLAVALSMALASLMAIVGSVLMARIYPNALFGKYDLVVPSLLTWLPLMWYLQNSSRRRIWMTGLGSPFLGAAWALIMRSGPAHEISYPSGIFGSIIGFGGGLLYAAMFVFVYAPITFPVGMVTAFLIRGVWKVLDDKSC